MYQGSSSSTDQQLYEMQANPGKPYDEASYQHLGESQECFVETGAG
jgi:hypothetical protein